MKNILDNERYNNLEFVVLDYNSKDAMESWFQYNLMPFIDNGKVIYYQTKQPTIFNHSHAKNLAFKLASGDIVCNINADHFTGKDFANFVNQQYTEDDNIVITPIRYPPKENKWIPKDVLGKVCVKKSDFLEVEGFDEQMVSYGFEDWDFINRLENKGVKRSLLIENEFLKHLSHPDDERFSIEKTYSNLLKLLIRHVSPAVSNLIFIFSTGQYEIGNLVDNTSFGHENFESSYLPRHYDYEFSVMGGRWGSGMWTASEGFANLTFKAPGKSPFDLFSIDSGFEANIDGSTFTFFEVENTDIKAEILEFHYLYENRCILEENKQNSILRPNFGQFGKALVYKNFNYDIQIQID